MKFLNLFLAVFFFTLACQGQAPGFVGDIEHKAIHLDTTDGRKLLVVLMPVQPDTNSVGQLLRFYARHGRQVRIILVLAPGTGVLMSGNPGHLYNSFRNTDIVLTEGMADTDSIAGPRSGLLRYLSHKNRNRPNELFAEGAKYFISEKGRLFAMLGKDDSLDFRVADYLIQTKVPGEDRL